MYFFTNTVKITLRVYKLFCKFDIHAVLCYMYLIIIMNGYIQINDNISIIHGIIVKITKQNNVRIIDINKPNSSMLIHISNIKLILRLFEETNIEKDLICNLPIKIFCKRENGKTIYTIYDILNKQNNYDKNFDKWLLHRRDTEPNTKTNKIIYDPGIKKEIIKDSEKLHTWLTNGIDNKPDKYIGTELSNEYNKYLSKLEKIKSKLNKIDIIEEMILRGMKIKPDILVAKRICDRTKIKNIPIKFIKLLIEQYLPLIEKFHHLTSKYDLKSFAEDLGICKILKKLENSYDKSDADELLEYDKINKIYLLSINYIINNNFSIKKKINKLLLSEINIKNINKLFQKDYDKNTNILEFIGKYSSYYLEKKKDIERKKSNMDILWKVIETLYRKLNNKNTFSEINKILIDDRLSHHSKLNINKVLDELHNTLIHKIDNEWYTLIDRFNEQVFVVNFHKNLNSMPVNMIDNYGEYTEGLKSLQPEFIKKLACNNICTLIGGPGTGKSHTTATAIRMHCENDLNCIIVGPTGMSVLNMKSKWDDEQSKIYTKDVKPDFYTMHKVFHTAKNDYCTGHPDYCPGETTKFYSREDKKKCEKCKILDALKNVHTIFIDEAGMIDDTTMYEFIKVVKFKCKNLTKICYIGDCHQLSPIGYGSPFQSFNKLSNSQINMNILELIEILRTDNKEIPELCKQINDGNSTFFDNYDSQTQNSPVTWAEHDPTYSILSNYSPDKMAIIADTNRKCAEINKHIQKNIYSRNIDSYNFKTDVFFEGTRVLINKNCTKLDKDDKNISLVNGNFGKIIKIEEEDDKLYVQIEIDCGEKPIVIYEIPIFEPKDKYFNVFKINNDKYYTPSEKDICGFQVGYATTVHKFQGSEHKNIIYYMVSYYWERNLPYTAISRAKHTVKIVGSKKLFKTVIGNQISYEYSAYDYILENGITYEEEYPSYNLFKSKLYDGSITTLNNKRVIRLMNYGKYRDKTYIWVINNNTYYVKCIWEKWENIKKPDFMKSWETNEYKCFVYLKKKIQTGKLKW